MADEYEHVFLLASDIAGFTKLWSMTDYNGGPWVGLEQVDGAWRWVSGLPLDWSPWKPGEPNGTGDKACFFSYQTGPKRETTSPEKQASKATTPVFCKSAHSALSVIGGSWHVEWNSTMPSA